MIKAIIFDCFGVLATDDWLPFKHAHFGSDRAKFDQASDLNQQANAGFISYQQFVTDIAALARVSEAEVQKVLRSNQPNRFLFELITSLQGRYKIGMLSNSASDWLTDIFTKQQLGLFDETILSYEVGMAKPDPRIYALATEKLGVEPEECVFIDDQERYCTAATEVGMQAIAYTDFDDFKLQLEKLLAQG
jgi:putative hydrolase of the HAD superfamily